MKKSVLLYFSTTTLIALSLALCLTSCKNDGTKASAPDVSDQQVEVELIRFEKAVAALNKDRPLGGYTNLLVKHPRITDLYFKQLMGIYHPNRDSLGNRLKLFLNDKRINDLNALVTKTYPDTKSIEKELTESLKYYKYYFPDAKLPRFYTLFTEFGFQPFIFDDLDGRDGIGIGLDMFLGKDYDYKSINPTDPVFSSYLTRTYDRSHLTKKTIEILVEDAIGPAPGKRFIDLMIHQGKKFYILKKIMPNTPDNIIYEYTAEQMAWMDKNELQVWDFYLELDLMYDTDHLKLSKLLSPSPTTQGMPAGSPGRTTAYIGKAIVEAFMEREKIESLADLIKVRDSQLLLEKSRYKPARRK